MYSILDDSPISYPMLKLIDTTAVFIIVEIDTHAAVIRAHTQLLTNDIVCRNFINPH